MITVLCEKGDSDVNIFAQTVAKHLVDLKFKVSIEDCAQGVSYGSFSIFIFTNSLYKVHHWGKFGALSISGHITESLLLTAYNNLVFYFTLELTHTDFSTVFPANLSVLVPNLPNYKAPNYFTPTSEPVPRVSASFPVHSATLICDQEDYQVYSVCLLSSQQYEPGYNLSLFPQNTDSLVSELCAQQSYSEFWTISIPSLFEDGQNLKTYLKEYCDLTSLIRKSTLKLLAQYCTDESFKEELEILTSLKGKERFVEVIVKNHLSIVEILERFRIQVPPGDLLQILDRIKPRYYSVATDWPENLGFVIQNMAKGKHAGCFSRYVNDISRFPEQSIRGEVKPSVFVMKPGPLLLISNGCGIAPFRSILFHVVKFPESYPNTLLIAGFRSPDHFIFRQEIEALALQHSSINLLIGYSRLGKKTYVQDLINQFEDQVVEILVNGHTFICGGTQMGKSVTELLKSFSEKQGKDWNDTKLRIKCETWG